MRIGQVAAIYSIIIGVAMLVMWAAFLATGRVPELNTALCEIVFHMVAEGATALALIVGGCGLLAGEKWGLQAYMLSMGMLLYTLIMSPGYSLQRNDMIMAGMFAAFFIVAIVLVALSFIRTSDYLLESQ